MVNVHQQKNDQGEIQKKLASNIMSELEERLSYQKLQVPLDICPGRV